MKKKFIAIGTPTLGNVSIEWASVLRALAWPLNTGYVNFFVIDAEGGEIAESRNRIVSLALQYEDKDNEVSHIFWLDDDVICSRFALLKLLEHNVDIAGGVYFTKSECSEPLIFPGRGCGTTPFVPDQVFETWGIGMGLTLVKTEVYKKMEKELDLEKDKYNRISWYKTTGMEHATIEDNIMWCGGTEDLYFLNLASKIGIKTIVDTSRMAFGWHYDKIKNVYYPKQQRNQFVKNEKILWQTPKGLKGWN